jgi:putative peptidoglycan lipid II flippase
VRRRTHTSCSPGRGLDGGGRGRHNARPRDRGAAAPITVTWSRGRESALAADTPKHAAAAPAHHPGGRIAGRAGLVSIATSLSRLGGLVREQLFASLLGAGFYSDAFVVAFRIPNLLRDLLAEGALSTAFVPTFTQRLVRDGRREADALGNLVLTSIFVLTGLLAVTGILAAGPLVRLFAPGFAATPGKLELTVQLTRLLFPFLPMVALAAVLMGMLNAQQRFFVPALAPALFNAVAVSVGVGLYALHVASPVAVYLWTGAVLAGGLVQFLVQIPVLARTGWRYKWRFDWRATDPGLQQILRLMVPAFIGLSATQLNILVNNVLASRLEQGSPSWINYAFRLMQLPIGVFGVAVATVNLASVSRAAAAGDMHAFRATLASSLKLVAFLTLPATAGLVALREPIVALLYEHGRFTAHDTARTAAVVMAFAVGLYAYASVKVLAPAFYALHAPRLPLFASLGAVGCNVAVNLVFYRWLGAPGLALGTSIGALVNFGALLVGFTRRYGGLHGFGLGTQIVRVAAASAGMGLVCRYVGTALGTRIGHATWVQDIAVTLPPILLGMPLYFGLAWLLRVEETRLVIRLVSRLLGRRHAGT